MKGLITEQVYICVNNNYQCRSHGYHRLCCSPCTVGVFEDVPQPREGRRWGPGGNGCTDVPTGTAHKGAGIIARMSGDSVGGVCWQGYQVTRWLPVITA